MKLSNKILLGGFVFLCLLILGFVINLRLYVDKENMFDIKSSHVYMMENDSSSFII